MPCVLARPPGDSNAHSSLRTTAELHDPRAKLVVLGYVDVQFSNQHQANLSLHEKVQKWPNSGNKKPNPRQLVYIHKMCLYLPVIL